MVFIDIRRIRSLPLPGLPSGSLKQNYRSSRKGFVSSHYSLLNMGERVIINLVLLGKGSAQAQSVFFHFQSSLSKKCLSNQHKCNQSLPMQGVDYRSSCSTCTWVQIQFCRKEIESYLVVIDSRYIFQVSFNNNKTNVLISIPLLYLFFNQF